MAVSRQFAGATTLISVLYFPAAAAAMDGPAAATAQVSMAPDAHVRGMSDRLLALISDATERSRTFRTLVDQINATDGIVYIGEGKCGHAVRACLLWTMTTMGPHRVLRIRVDTQNRDRELIGSIGHELHHALEVLTNRETRTDTAIAMLYRRIGSMRGTSFETEAAIKAGDAVRAEVRRSARRD